jgi:hypothetical protein
VFHHRFHKESSYAPCRPLDVIYFLEIGPLSKDKEIDPL